MHNPHEIEFWIAYKITNWAKPIAWSLPRVSLLSPMLKSLKSKNLFDEISYIRRSVLNQSYPTLAETFLFGLNSLSDKESALKIDRDIITKEYITKENYQIILFLENSNRFWITLFHIFQLFKIYILHVISRYNIEYSSVYKKDDIWQLVTCHWDILKTIVTPNRTLGTDELQDTDKVSEVNFFSLSGIGTRRVNQKKICWRDKNQLTVCFKRSIA